MAPDRCRCLQFRKLRLSYVPHSEVLVVTMVHAVAAGSIRNPLGGRWVALEGVNIISAVISLTSNCSEVENVHGEEVISVAVCEYLESGVDVVRPSLWHLAHVESKNYSIIIADPVGDGAPQ